MKHALVYYCISVVSIMATAVTKDTGKIFYVFTLVYILCALVVTMVEA